MTERVKIILNPYSGRGAGARVRARLCEALTRAEINFDLAETSGVGHGIELARQARMDGYATVVAVGGDGTVNEVMNGLALATPLEASVGKLAIIPLGTGNDFAAMVGCAANVEQAVQAIALGKTRRIDLGQAAIDRDNEARDNEVGDNERIYRYFDNNLGVGFEAWVTLESYKIKRLSGVLLYLAAALRALNSYRPPQMDIQWQTLAGETNRRTQKTLLVSVGNSRRTGGGFYLTPDAKLDDGLFDIGIANAIPARQVLLLLPKALFGKHTGDKAITMARCCQLQIDCPEGMPIHLDGEVITSKAKRVEVTIQPGRLEVIV